MHNKISIMHEETGHEGRRAASDIRLKRTELDELNDWCAQEAKDVKRVCVDMDSAIADLEKGLADFEGGNHG